MSKCYSEECVSKCVYHVQIVCRWRDSLLRLLSRPSPTTVSCWHSLWWEVALHSISVSTLDVQTQQHCSQPQKILYFFAAAQLFIQTGVRKEARSTYFSSYRLIHVNIGSLFHARCLCLPVWKKSAFICVKTSDKRRRGLGKTSIPEKNL